MLYCGGVLIRGLVTNKIKVSVAEASQVVLCFVELHAYEDVPYDKISPNSEKTDFTATTAMSKVYRVIGSKFANYLRRNDSYKTLPRGEVCGKRESWIRCSYTAVYYINSCNGYTYFEDGYKVKSVANRIVIFPRDTQHSGTTSSDSYRQVINFNYYGYD